MSVLRASVPKNAITVINPQNMYSGQFEWIAYTGSGGVQVPLPFAIGKMSIIS